MYCSTVSAPCTARLNLYLLKIGFNVGYMCFFLSVRSTSFGRLLTRQSMFHKFLFPSRRPTEVGT